MRVHCSLRYLSAAVVFALTSFSAHAQVPPYPNFITDAQVPVPTTDALSNPRGLAVAPGGIVYIADTGNGRVLQILPSGAQTTITFGTLKPALVTPGGLALDAAQNLYVTDTATNRVIKLPAGSANGLTIITGLNAPTTIAADPAGNLAILNSGNNTITTRRAGGQAALFNTGSTTFETPVALAFNTHGALYVGDQGSGSDQGALYLFPEFGGTAVSIPPPSYYGTYSRLTALAIDAAGNLFLANKLYSIYDDNDDTHGLWEMPAAGGPTLNVPTTSFVHLSAVALDSLGNVYIADANVNTVNKLFYNNAADFGSVPVGSSSQAILFNFAFYLDDTIQSSQALTAGVADGEYAAGGTSPYGASLGSTPCAPGNGKVLYISEYPIICTVVYHFHPTGVGGRPGAIQLKTSAGTASQPVWGRGLGSQLALLNAAITPKLTNYHVSNLIANATGTELYFTSAAGTYRVPADSNTPTLISPLKGQLAVNGAGDLFIFNAPNITRIPADGTAPTTIHVPGLANPQGFAMDYNNAFYITDLGPDFEGYPIGNGFVERLSSTGIASHVLPAGYWESPSFITPDYDGNLVITDTGNRLQIRVEVGTGSYAESSYDAVLEGEGNDNPIDLAVDTSDTVFYWTQDDSGLGLVYAAPSGKQPGTPCNNSGSCDLPLYANPGYYDPDFGYKPFLAAPGFQAFTAASNSKLYIVNGNAPGVLLIDRTFGTILPQAFTPGFHYIGGPTQQGYVFNSGNQDLVFTDPNYVFTQSGSTAAFTFSDGQTAPCQPGTTVNPGNYCTFAVTDSNAPSATQAVDTLHFLTNATNTSTANFKITGPPAP